MASNIKNQLFSWSVLYRTGTKYSGIVISLVIAGILVPPPISGRLRNRSRCHRNHRFFQPPHRYGNISPLSYSTNH